MSRLIISKYLLPASGTQNSPKYVRKRLYEEVGRILLLLLPFRGLAFHIFLLFKVLWDAENTILKVSENCDSSTWSCAKLRNNCDSVSKEFSVAMFVSCLSRLLLNCFPKSNNNARTFHYFRGSIVTIQNQITWGDFRKIKQQKS